MHEIAGAAPAAPGQPFRPARAFAAFAVCALLLLLWQERPAAPESGRAPRAAAQPGLAEISEALNKLPDQKQVSQWIGQIDGPLENEMRLVVDDAKTAYASLANSFLAADPPR